MQVERTKVSSIIFRALGTVALAAAFLLMVTRFPFFPTREPTMVTTDTVDAERRRMPNLRIDPGLLPGMPPGESNFGDGLSLQTPMGLHKARFAGTPDSPGFSTREHQVTGECQGAGRRHIAAACPDCPIAGGETGIGAPEMLMWTESAGDESIIHAVAEDCTSFDALGAPVVTQLTFGGGAINLADETEELALDQVPLLPGATRLAVVEIGGWLTTYDEVGSPSSALNDMARELFGRGWRPAPDSVREDLATFEGDRVFINGSNAFCVISLQREGGKHHLTTIMSS